MHDFIAISEFKLKLQSGNVQFGSKSTIFLCDLDIWRMTLKINRAPLPCYFKLCASFHSHWWIQTGVTVRKRPIWVKFDDFLRPVTLKFDGWPWKTIGHLFYTNSSFVHHFKAICELKLELQCGNAQFGSKSVIFCPVWPWNLTDDLENHRAPLLCYFKLCTSFHSHWWIQTEVTVRKMARLGLNSVTLTFDLWHWPFAWTSLLSLVITPENFMMIWWWEHSEKEVTDRWIDGRTETDRRTDWTIHRAAWSQLKTIGQLS